jgi:hypothetical protein
MDLLEQFQVAVRHVKPLQLVEDGFEGGDCIVTGFRRSNHHQPAVDVGLLRPEARDTCLQVRVVVTGGLVGI